MKFPTMEQVDAASKLKLARWIVGLPENTPSPQKPIMDRIFFRFFIELDGWTPELKKSTSAGTRFNAVMHLN